jgi:phosphoglycolate phosphatase
MNNDAIIFDIDGTLWNASPAVAKGWNRAIKKLGINIKITEKQIESVAGNPLEECIEIILPGLQKQFTVLAETIEKYQIELLKVEGGKFYDGVIDGIKTLSGSYKIFLVSNCDESYLNLFLKFSSLAPVLTGFECHGMSGLPKSKMLNKIKSNYSLNNPVYIGDTSGDESAAKSANMEFIHASYGFGSPNGKVLSFNTFAALLDYFKSKAQPKKSP